MEPEEQVTEPDLKQKEKDEALQRRKEELEGELERYAQAGAFSPSLIKFTKWLSRGMYLAMAAGFMIMLFSGWGKVSQKDYDTAVQRAIDIKATATEAKTKLSEAETARVIAETKAALFGNELDELKAGRPVADAAQAAAQNLIERAWGERSYAEHWRSKLAVAEPEAHGDNPGESVKLLLRQAASAPAAQQFEVLSEIADFGADSVWQSRTNLKDTDLEVVRLTALLIGRLETAEAAGALLEALKTEEDVKRRRALQFALETLKPGTCKEHGGYFEAEAWLGDVLTRHDGAQPDLIAAYRKAPAENRLELLALLAEASAAIEADFFTSVATSDRPLAEKIIAVRWMGERKSQSSKTLLTNLSDEQGVLAEEAKAALRKLTE